MEELPGTVGENHPGPKPQVSAHSGSGEARLHSRMFHVLVGWLEPPERSYELGKPPLDEAFGSWTGLGRRPGIAASLLAVRQGGVYFFSRVQYPRVEFVYELDGGLAHPRAQPYRPQGRHRNQRNSAPGARVGHDEVASPVDWQIGQAER